MILWVDWAVLVWIGSLGPGESRMASLRWPGLSWRGQLSLSPYCLSSSKKRIKLVHIFPSTRQQFSQHRERRQALVCKYFSSFCLHNLADILLAQASHMTSTFSQGREINIFSWEKKPSNTAKRCTYKNERDYFANNLPHKLIISVLTAENVHKPTRLINKLGQDKSQVFRKSLGVEMVTIVYNLPKIATGPEACWITSDHTSIQREYH